MVDSSSRAAAAVMNGRTEQVGWSTTAPARPRPVGVPTSPRRPRNTLWMVTGLLLVLVSGLSALLIARSLSNRVDVLVATRAIAAGETITDGDLVTRAIAAPNDVRAISPAQKAEFVGRVAAGPIGAGSVVHRAQFVDPALVDGPEVVVGAALDPGGYPLAGLAPGDRVLIIEVNPGAGGQRDAAAVARQLSEGEVVAVEALSRSDALLVSLRVAESMAVTISERAGQGRIRLALVTDPSARAEQSGASIEDSTETDGTDG